MEERENVLNDMRNGSDCANILDNYPDTRLRDGVYNIMVSNKTKAVYCDMTTDNGGWTVHFVFFLCISMYFDKIRSLETYFSNDKFIFNFFINLIILIRKNLKRI